MNIENFRSTGDSIGYVAWFDCRLAEAGIRFFSMRLMRPEKSPSELWLHFPTRTDCITAGRPVYHLDRDLRSAIGEAAAAKYRAATGVDAFYVAPPRRGEVARADEPDDDAAGVRRVLGVVEETLERAGL